MQFTKRNIQQIIQKNALNDEFLCTLRHGFLHIMPWFFAHYSFGLI